MMSRADDQTETAQSMWIKHPSCLLTVTSHRPEMSNTRPGMSYLYAYKIYTYLSKALFASKSCLYLT